MSRKSDAAEIQLKRSRLIATDEKATFELTTLRLLGCGGHWSPGDRRCTYVRRLSARMDLKWPASSASPTQPSAGIACVRKRGRRSKRFGRPPLSGTPSVRVKGVPEKPSLDSFRVLLRYFHRGVSRWLLQSWEFYRR